MMRRRRQAVAGALCGLGVATPLWLVLVWDRRPAPVVPAPLAIAVRQEATAEPLHPAFTAGEEPATPAPPPPLPQLVAIVGRLPSAPLIMMRLPDDSLRTVSPGQRIEGWQVARVTLDRVELRRGADLRLLVLPVRPPQ